MQQSRRRSKNDTPPFTQIPNSVLFDTELSESAVRVYLAIRSHAYGDDGCYPGIPRIAALIDLSERTVKRSIHQLVERGYLTIQRRPNQSNRYRFPTGDHTSGEATTDLTNTPGEVTGVHLVRPLETYEENEEKKDRLIDPAIHSDDPTPEEDEDVSDIIEPLGIADTPSVRTTLLALCREFPESDLVIEAYKARDYTSDKGATIRSVNYFLEWCRKAQTLEPKMFKPPELPREERLARYIARLKEEAEPLWGTGVQAFGKEVRSDGVRFFEYQYLEVERSTNADWNLIRVALRHSLADGRDLDACCRGIFTCSVIDGDEDLTLSVPAGTSPADLDLWQQEVNRLTGHLGIDPSIRWITEEPPL